MCIASRYHHNYFNLATQFTHQIAEVQRAKILGILHGGKPKLIIASSMCQWCVALAVSLYGSTSTNNMQVHVVS